MDRPVKDDDREPFFHISSSSSSPVLTYLDTHPDHTTTNNQRQQQGFDFSAPDVLSGYDFQASTQPRRRTFSVEHGSSRHHHSSGSPVYLTGELFSARKDAEMDSHNSKIASAVERTIKKYADNILRVLEGMNGRLSQLESVSQVLEHSVASLKASVDDYHDKGDARSKALNNHVEEMHRAVQILRDKQDIVETNAELAKLQASKAEAAGEKASALVPATKQPVASSQIVTQEQLALEVSSQQSNNISGQLRQLSLSADVNTLPQQQVPAQAHILLQSHVYSPSEVCPALQPQEMIHSMPGVFQARSQHAQTPQGFLQAQTQDAQTQQGLHQAQTQQVQGKQSVQSQQGAFQAQPRHVQTQHSVQLQQGMFQAQPQHMYIQQSAQSQEGTLQTHQPHVQTLPSQQGAFQTQAHYAHPQQGVQAPQGAFQAHPQHLQTQKIAQSQQGTFQAQQHYIQQTQQNVQSQQGAIEAQLQMQKNMQPHQGPQGKPFRGPAQQLQPPPSQISNQTTNLPSQSMVGHVIVQPPRTPNAHLPVQGVPTGQGSFPFTQKIESFSHAPLPQATVTQAPPSSQVEYGAGPPYNVSNTDSSQQHSLYSQPAQDSNAYQRFPSPLQGPQPVYASQRTRPVTPTVTSARALPLAQNVYNPSLAGGPPNQLLRDDGIVDKVAVMGFSRDEARSAIKRLTDQGQLVDMNAVLDLLMNRRNQSQGGWQAR